MRLSRPPARPFTAQGYAQSAYPSARSTVRGRRRARSPCLHFATIDGDGMATERSPNCGEIARHGNVARGQRQSDGSARALKNGKIPRHRRNPLLAGSCIVLAARSGGQIRSSASGKKRNAHHSLAGICLFGAIPDSRSQRMACSELTKMLPNKRLDVERVCSTIGSSAFSIRRL